LVAQQPRLEVNAAWLLKTHVKSAISYPLNPDKNIRLTLAFNIQEWLIKGFKKKWK